MLTSGNRSDEPIVFRDEDVVERLGPLVEGILSHTRPIHGASPAFLAHDLPPEYLSTKFTEDRAATSGEPLFPVQHHPAHVAACPVDAGETGPVVGVAFDGLGYGPDGTLWGGELLVCDLDGYRRAGHLVGVAMPGGAAAVREPWRMALAWSLVAGGVELAGLAEERFEPWWRALVAPTGAGRFPLTSWVGRLFDAIAALVGLRHRVSYEGQAAIELEMVARGCSPRAARRYEVAVEVGNEVLLDPSLLVAAVVADSRAGVDTAAIARGFHEALAAATAVASAEVAARAGLGTVALSGGVFQNVLLGEALSARLEARGLRLLRHRRIQPNDGGISIGQAAIAATAARAPGEG